MPRFLIPKELTPGETRVAATPDTVKKMIALDCKVLVEQGAGLLSGFEDLAYESVGAELIPIGNSGMEQS